MPAIRTAHAHIPQPPYAVPPAREGVEHAFKTTQAYEPRQKEWHSWCDGQTATGFAGGERYTVTEEKLALFLEEYVLKRTIAKRPASAARASTASNESAEGTESTASTESTSGTSEAGDDDLAEGTAQSGGLGWSSISLYVAAVVDLWRTQQPSGTNTHYNPRSGRVQALLATVRQQLAPKKPHPARSMAEGDVAKLAQDGMVRGCKEGVRDRLMVLLSHVAGLSGTEVRTLEYSDIHLHADVDSGVRVEVKGRVVGRKENVECCVVGALALHLFLAQDRQEGDKVFGSATDPKTAISDAAHFHTLRSARVRQGVDKRELKYLMRASPVVGTGTERVGRDIEVPAEILDAVFPERKEALLDGLRSVLVHDAAVLWLKHPSHPMFTHGGFQGSAFEAFASRIPTRSSVCSAQASSGPQLVTFPGTSVQLTAEQMGEIDRAVAGLITQKMDARQREHDQQLAEVKQSLDRLQQSIQRDARRKAEFFLFLADKFNVALNAEDLDAASMGSITATRNDDTPDAGFYMDRGINSVAELWTEYVHGANGKPSPQSLVQRRGFRWKSESDRKFFTRRSVILDEVKRRAQQGEPDEETVAGKLDGYMVKMGIRSLSQLQDRIKQGDVPECLE